MVPDNFIVQWIAGMEVFVIERDHPDFRYVPAYGDDDLQPPQRATLTASEVWRLDRWQEAIGRFYVRQ